MFCLPGPKNEDQFNLIYMFEDSLLNQSIVRNRHKYRNIEKFSSALNFFYFKYCFSSEK